MPAAIASECAGEQGKFWEYHDKLFEDTKALADADLEKYATALGLNVGKWQSCYKEQKPKKKIQAKQRAITTPEHGEPRPFSSTAVISPVPDPSLTSRL